MPAMTVHETTFGDATAIFPEARKNSSVEESNVFFGVLDGILGDDKETDNESESKEALQSPQVVAFSALANEKVAYCVPILK